MEFSDFYKLSTFISAGAFGDFFACVPTNSEQESNLTVKVIRVQRDKKSGCELQPRGDIEVAIWRRLKHPNIVEVLRAFKSFAANYVVVDRVDGGLLLDYVASYTTYTERDGCFLVRQLFAALAYLNERRIVHRNITPECLLIEKSSRGEVLKVTDFGLAIRMPKRCCSMQCDPQGTPLYAAPEIIRNESVTHAVDCWSAGVILYLLLGGYPPFWNDKPTALCCSVLKWDVEFTPPYWDKVSELAKDTVAGLLKKESCSRLTAKQALKQTWFERPEKLPCCHRQKTVDKLKEFNARRKLKSAVFSTQLLKDVCNMHEITTRRQAAENDHLSRSWLLNYPYRESILDKTSGITKAQDVKNGVRKASVFVPLLKRKQESKDRRKSEGHVPRKSIAGNLTSARPADIMEESVNNENGNLVPGRRASSEVKISLGRKNMFRPNGI